MKSKVLKDLSIGQLAYDGHGKRIYLVPDGIEHISSRVFEQLCVDTIILPESVKTIDDKAFYKNIFVKEIVLPSNLISIGSSAFEDCTNLEKINLPDSLVNLSEMCFSNCTKLKEIKLPKNLKLIDNYCFNNCENLYKIQFNNNLETIGLNAFNNCKLLDNVKIPNSVHEIGSRSFSNCYNLKKIVLSENLKVLQNDLFSHCKNLENIVIPNSVEIIESFCFSNCLNLKNITLPHNLKKISASICQNCKSLEEFYLENNRNVIIDDSALSFCYGLKRVYIYIKSPNNFSTGKLIDLDLNGFKSSHIHIHENNFEKLNALSKNISKYIKIPFNFAKNLIRHNQDENFSSGNFKFYKRLEKLFLNNVCNADEQNFLLLCYNLGVFHQDKEIANKSTVFIEEILTTKLISFDTLIQIFENMQLQGYKKDYTNFITKKDNFKKMLNLFNNGFDIFSESYNNFEKIQEVNLSKNVQHRQLVPTVEKCKEFLTINKFNYVTDETKDIAEEIGKFSNKQDDFELGVRIMNHYNRMKEVTNYEDLVIEENPFEKINSLEKEIFKTNVDSVNNITNLIDNDYTFEWLKKNDPKNLMLGYYCSCCAHIDGTGEGIMIASIVHPSTRNLVVKDENGKIVAKFTLYVNEKKGYGIFNTASINSNLSIKDNDKRNILKLLLKATNSYVVAYNKKHDIKLKQINIGDHLNGLSYLFNEFNIQKTEILKGINFKRYSDNYEYEGDSNEGQYLIFKLEEDNEKL